ncbi:MAG: Gfo/Idh/MocA family oxidoreductase [Planctomycetes bacterium]|nr:Gfo/Idh/MocA family oxidoreductase [Planctomycetota bacterium]
MEKLRLGVIGVGSVVREIYQYLYFSSDFSSIVDVVAVADPNDEYRNWFCDKYGIASDRRFKDYSEMLDRAELDAVQVNTPDHLHAAPSIAAMKRGLDVLVPKPTADTVTDVDAMIRTAEETGRLLTVDFHKREDPRFKEAETRYQSGRYGQLQVAVWYMLDKLLVANPNHDPPFFASADFAEKNTPISFLTVHMADALMKITHLRPVAVRAVGWSQKLPQLRPRSVQGYDCCDTEIRFENGAIAHIITGWHLPDTAYSTTVQSARMICTDGLIDFSIDRPGYFEVHADGIFEVNPLFKNFEKDGTVTGYGMTSPGRLLQKILAFRAGRLSDAERSRLADPMELGFYTTLVCAGAHESLQRGQRVADGVTEGAPVDLRELLIRQLGTERAGRYLE